MKTFYRSLFAVNLWLLANTGLAQQQTQEIQLPDEMVITSNRIPVPLRQIGTSVSVIMADEIQARGSLGLTDVLRQLPAIGASANGGLGQPTSLRIRGEEGYRTLTIIDGIRVSDPGGTQIVPQFEHIISGGIGRVEILRGPQGLAYGADAGGVVNISTLQPAEDSTANLDLQAGKFNTSQVSGNLGGRIEGFDYFVSAINMQTEGFNSRDTDTVLRDDDGYDNTTFHARVGYDFNEHFRLDLVHRNVDGETEFDACSFPTVYVCLAKFDQQASRIELSYASDKYSHSISYASTETDRDNLASGVSTFATSGELQRVEYVGSATALPGFNLVYGLDHEEAILNGKGRNNLGTYIEYLSDFSDHVFFTAGVRHDDNDDFGTNNSFRLSAAWLVDLADGGLLKYRGSYGTGFRAPSPFEIAYNTGPFAFPPASSVALKQEKSRGYEFGIEYTSSNNLEFQAVYFDQEVEDAVIFDLAGFSGYLQDTGTSTSKGIELSTGIPISAAFDVVGNYTYNDTERPNSLQRLRRPEHLSNLGLSYFGMDDRLNLNAFYRISRDAIDEQFGVPVALDNFGVMDITASYSINDNFQIYSRVENLFDEEYEEIFTYNKTGRALFVGVRVNL